MALSRSVFWLFPSISSKPDVAIERVKVHLLRNSNPKLRTSLLKAVPWIPRKFQSRGFSRELVQAAPPRASDPHSQVEASSSEGPDNSNGRQALIGGAEVTRKSPRRRRRTKKKTDEEKTSDDLSKRAESDDSQVVFRSNFQNGELLHVAATRADDPQGQVEASLSEGPDAEKDGEALMAGAEVTKKPPRRRRRTKRKVEEDKTSDDGAQRAKRDDTQVLLQSNFQDGKLSQVVATRTSDPQGQAEASPSEGPVGEKDGEALIAVAEVTKKPARRRRRTKRNVEEEKTSDDGRTRRKVGEEKTPDVVAETAESEGSPDRDENQVVLQSSFQNEQLSQVAVSLANDPQAQVEACPSEREKDGEALIAVAEVTKKPPRRRRRTKRNVEEETIPDDAAKRAESKGSPELEDSQVVLPSNLLNGSASRGGSENGTVRVDSIDMQNQTTRADSEVDEAIAGDSIDPAKLAKKGRRRKRKKVSSSLQSEAQVEVIVPSADDLYESIVWCTVHLKVQAELEENQRLYVVGANPELGGWDLSQALPLPESDEEGVWESTLKIPRGTMLEYKYFTESQDADSAVIERWFGPEIQYLLAWKDGLGSELEVINDLWIPDVPAKLPLLSWGDRWWEEMDPMNSNEGLRVLEQHQQLDFEQIYSRDDDALDVSEKKVEIPAEEPVIEEWLKKKIRRKVFPREEPWLLESMIMDQRNGSARKRNEDGLEGTDGGESVVAEQKDLEVQVEILINSPQSTMQRMAILEDGKLVELLLEPVNTRVQVGNVYLGVVRQLLPGMTGVFVDIGGFQLALLDITRNQYPYTFPSIGQSVDVPGDGQSWGSLDDDEESDWEDSETGDADDDEDEDEDEDEDDQDSEFVDDEDGVGAQLDEEVEDDTPRRRSTRYKGRIQDAMVEDKEGRADSKGRNLHSLTRPDSGSPPGPITVNFGRKLKKWRKLQEGMQIIVQVKKEALGKKGPRLTAFPSLAGRFWVLIPGGNAVGVSRRITGPERKRLRQMAQDYLPPNFSLTVRTEALGHSKEELEKDLARLMETWKEVLERASAAAVAAEHGMEGATPVLLHRAMGQFLTIVRDFFNDKVHRMVIDSPQCYQEVTSYLQEVAPQLSDRVELYTEKTPIFDEFDIESEIEKFSNRRVSLPNGGYLVMEETEALVSIDVNGGTSVLSYDISQEEAILAVNLAAARQIATELRLRDIGGIIVVDFIDMQDAKSEKMVYEEMRRAIARDRSSPSLSEISEFGLMEMTRKRVRPSVTLTISDPCSHCGGVGRVEAYETTLSKIERAVLRLSATRPGDTNSLDSTTWPQFILRVDNHMGEYLKGRKRKRMTQLSAALKVWLNLKVALEFSTGQFQVVEQYRIGSEKRSNAAGLMKSDQQKIGPDIFGRRGVWPGKRRRNFANQGSSKE